MRHCVGHLRQAGMLTRDPRAKERKKPGSQAGAQGASVHEALNAT